VGSNRLSEGGKTTENRRVKSHDGRVTPSPWVSRIPLIRHGGPHREHHLIGQHMAPLRHGARDLGIHSLFGTFIHEKPGHAYVTSLGLDVITVTHGAGVIAWVKVTHVHLGTWVTPSYATIP